MSGLEGCVHRLNGMADGSLQASFVETAYKAVAVLGVHDSLDTCAQHFNAIFLQHTSLVEFGATVKRRLSTKGQENAIRALLFDNLRHEVSRHGLEINLVGNAFRRLNGGNVRIHEHALNSFLAQSLQGLRARVVEFACLSNLQGTAAQHQHLGKFLVHHEFSVCYRFQTAKLQKNRGRAKEFLYFLFIYSSKLSNR